MQAVSGRTRESGKRPLLMSGLQGARCWRRTVTIDSEVRTLDHLNDVRHSHPSVIPASPPSFLHRLRHSCVPSVIPAPPPSFLPPSFPSPPSFLRRQESRRSVRVKGTPNVRRRPITRGALVGRRPDGGSSHGWAVAWIPASAGMTDRASVMAAHGHHRLRSPHARPSQRRAPFPTFRHSCAPSVIPAEAGIQAICAGQGHSQCSTAPDHPRGSGGPSAGWRLVARLGGRMDSCLRRNDGQGGCDGGARSPSTPKSARSTISTTCAIPNLPSFLRPLRHSCGGRNPGDLCGSRALPMFDGARSPAGLWWAVGRMEARRTVGRSHGFLPPQE